MILRNIDFIFECPEEDQIIKYLLSDETIRRVYKIKDANDEKDVLNNPKSVRRIMSNMARSSLSMIEGMLPQIATKDILKFIIEFKHEDFEQIKRINSYGEFYVQMPGNVKDFLQLTDYEKKEFVVKKVIEASEYIMSCTDINLIPLIETCRSVEEYNYVNHWLWRKPVKNGDYYAQVEIQHDINSLKINMVFFDSKFNRIKTVFLVETEPNEWNYHFFLGDLRWESDNVAVLLPKYDFMKYPKCYASLNKLGKGTK